MEMKDLASKYMQSRIFTAAELIEAAEVTELPVAVQYAIQRNGNPAKSMGHCLLRAEGIAAVGVNRKVKLWRVEA